MERQLQLFTPAELASMRDRTRSRNYSPANEGFRGEHRHHRDWGLARRHAEKLRRMRGDACAAPRPPRAGTEEEDRTTVPNPIDPAPARPAAPQPRAGHPSPGAADSGPAQPAGSIGENRNPMPAR